MWILHAYEVDRLHAPTSCCCCCKHKNRWFSEYSIDIYIFSSPAIQTTILSSYHVQCWHTRNICRFYSEIRGKEVPSWSIFHSFQPIHSTNWTNVLLQFYVCGHHSHAQITLVLFLTWIIIRGNQRIKHEHSAAWHDTVLTSLKCWNPTWSELINWAVSLICVHDGDYSDLAVRLLDSCNWKPLHARAIGFSCFVNSTSDGNFPQNLGHATRQIFWFTSGVIDVVSTNQ